ncbi:hypothetical protein ACX93W_01660 [Paenibacillus sp. CAU 1782]
MRNTKTPTERSDYYIRKVSEYSTVRLAQIYGRPIKKPKSNRFMRLMAYQDGLNRRVREWNRKATAI